MGQFDYATPLGQYMDVRAGIAADTNIALQLTSTTATQFILPTSTFGARQGSVDYDSVTGAIWFKEAGIYTLQMMLNCVSTANSSLLYRAATIDPVTGNPVAFGTAGRSFNFTGNTDALTTVVTINRWAANTKLLVYFTTSNVTSLVIRRATSTAIGAQAVFQEAARFQVSGALGI